MSAPTCGCGRPARLIVTTETIGHPNLVARTPQCRDTCDGQRPRPLLEVLQEHVDQVRAQREAAAR